jgi:isopenicillin-N N-acyltransferase-like protein
VRYFRAQRLLRQKVHHDLRSLERILHDHVNYPNSICSHEAIDDNPLDRQKTICSMVMDLTDRQMHIAWGNPCQSEYHTYTLES